MFCPNCGYENGNTNKFCLKCGKEFKVRLGGDGNKISETANSSTASVEPAVQPVTESVTQTVSQNNSQNFSNYTFKDEEKEEEETLYDYYEQHSLGGRIKNYLKKNSSEKSIYINGAKVIRIALGIFLILFYGIDLIINAGKLSSEQYLVMYYYDIIFIVYDAILSAAGVILIAANRTRSGTIIAASLILLPMVVIGLTITRAIILFPCMLLIIESLKMKEDLIKYEKNSRDVVVLLVITIIDFALFWVELIFHVNILNVLIKLLFA